MNKLPPPNIYLAQKLISLNFIFFLFSQPSKTCKIPILYKNNP